MKASEKNMKVKELFECRKGCGACCVAPSISSYIPGMADGKRAGIKCIHLDIDSRCLIFDSPSRPKVCIGFKAEFLICGNSREEAMDIMNLLES
jgi:uncharacterized protein